MVALRILTISSIILSLTGTAAAAVNGSVQVIFPQGTSWTIGGPHIIIEQGRTPKTLKFQEPGSVYFSWIGPSWDPNNGNSRYGYPLAWWQDCELWVNDGFKGYTEIQLRNHHGKPGIEGSIHDLVHIQCDNAYCDRPGNICEREYAIPFVDSTVCTEDFRYYTAQTWWTRYDDDEDE